MNVSELRQRVDSFSRWHYRFDLKGVQTPLSDAKANRHLQRKRYFFDPLLELSGGTLENKRVLDLGCNAGYWSMLCIQAGCDYVAGIDGRQMHIDQANLVFDVHGVEKQRYDFNLANLYEFDFKTLGEFDIVLCLGLMYHVSKPVLLMEKIAEVNNDLLVIDTSFSLAEGSFLEIRREPLEDPRMAVEYELVVSPTRRAVLDIVQQFGYSASVLKPQFSSYDGANEFAKGKRRAFLCSKVTDLDRLSVPVEETIRA